MKRERKIPTIESYLASYAKRPRFHYLLDAYRDAHELQRVDSIEAALKLEGLLRLFGYQYCRFPCAVESYVDCSRQVAIKLFNYVEESHVYSNVTSDRQMDYIRRTIEETNFDYYTVPFSTLICDLARAYGPRHYAQSALLAFLAHSPDAAEVIIDTIEKYESPLWHQVLLKHLQQFAAQPPR